MENKNIIEELKKTINLVIHEYSELEHEVFALKEELNEIKKKNLELEEENQNLKFIIYEK